MAQVIIRRGDRVSDGARALKEALVAAGISAVIKAQYATTTPALVVNWGSRDTLNVSPGSVVLNKPGVLGRAQDKKLTFTHLREAGFENIPDFWSHAPSAEQRGKDIIVERHTTTGEGGAGIVIKRPGEPLGKAPLYTRYIRKEIEIRVHIVGGQAVAVQQKRKREGAQMTEDQQLVRNHDNGWIFAVNDVNEAAARAAKPVAEEACRILGIDLGAVDIAIRKKDNKPMVLEVNTRPGIESDTVIAAYVNKLRTLIPAGAVARAPRVREERVVRPAPAARPVRTTDRVVLDGQMPRIVRREPERPVRDPYAIPPKTSNKRVVMRDGTTWKWITTRKNNRVWRQVA